ncbi:hypothetical protein D3C72_2091670 [compost metagenome]
MGCQEQAIAGGGPLVGGQLEEPLDGVHLAMPERIFDLVIGFRDHGGQVGLPQDRGTEELVAAGHATGGDRRDLLLDNIEQP